jgi:hypothetical protein
MTIGVRVAFVYGEVEAISAVNLNVYESRADNISCHIYDSFWPLLPGEERLLYKYRNIK